MRAEHGGTTSPTGWRRYSEGPPTAGNAAKQIARLQLQPRDRGLEVCVGTGTNVPLMWEAMPSLDLLVGLDISPAMLRRCVKKAGDAHAPVTLVEGDAVHLPFGDGVFDAVFHHGGIAEFGDRRAAIVEMSRVARPGAKIVICDVGVPTDRKLPFVSRMLLKTQPEYDKPPPIDDVPANASGVQPGWIASGSWYLLEFSNGPR